MTNTTKAQLAAENAALRTQISQLTGDLEIANARVAKAVEWFKQQKAAAPAPKPQSQSTWTSGYRKARVVGHVSQ